MAFLMSYKQSKFQSPSPKLLWISYVSINSPNPDQPLRSTEMGSCQGSVAVDCMIRLPSGQCGSRLYSRLYVRNKNSKRSEAPQHQSACEVIPPGKPIYITAYEPRCFF